MRILTYISLPFRPECIRLGADSLWLEADPGASSYQQGCDIRAVVPVRAQIRCWLRSSCDFGLLFRRGERLVDFEALEEAD